MNSKLKVFIYLILISVSSLSFAVETNDPVISELTFSPTMADVVGGSVIVTAQVKVEDESTIIAPSGKPFFLSSSLNNIIQASSPWVEINVTETYAIFESSFEINRYALPAEDYALGTQSFSDEWGNWGGTNSSYFDTFLTIVNPNIETNDPVISELTFSPTMADVVGGSVIVTAQVKVEDESTIIAPSGKPFFLSSSLKNSIQASSPWVEINVTETYAIFESSFEINRIALPAEDYALGTQSFSDEWGNWGGTNSSYFDTFLTIVNGPDGDLDGVSDINDAFPFNSMYSKDSDGDGMPGAWETRYGLDPNDASDATSDIDNDGVTALDEFLAGTIPAGSLDIDGNGQYDALTDGLLLLRGMFLLSGDALISDAVAPDAAYKTSDEVTSRIDMLGDLVDIDGNGNVDALTDGLVILRYLFNLRGDVLIKDVIASDSTVKTAEGVEAKIEQLKPSL